MVKVFKNEMKMIVRKMEKFHLFWGKSAFFKFTQINILTGPDLSDNKDCY